MACFIVRRFLNLRARILKPLSVPAIKFLESLPHIWELLTGAQKSELQFLQNADQIKPSVLRRVIKDFFSVYTYLILGAAELGAAIIRGEFHSSFLGFKFKKRSFKQTDMIAGIIAAIGLTKYLEKLAILSKPVFELFSDIGSNRKDVIKGVKIFFKAYHTIIEDVSKIKINSKFYWKAFLLITVAQLMTILFKISENIFKNLVYLGRNKRQIRRGLKAFSMMFVSSFRRLSATPSLIDIVNRSRVTAGVLVRSLLLITFTTLMAIEMVLVNSVATTLIRLGRRRRAIKRGLKTFHYMILKMIDIIQDEKIKKLKVAEVIRSVSMIGLLVSLFAVILLPTQAIGMMAPLLIAALFSILVLTAIIPLMIFDMLLVIKFEKIILKGAPILKLIATSFSDLATTISKLNGIKLTKALGAIVVLTGAIILAMLTYVFIGKANKNVYLGIAVTSSIATSLILMAASLGVVNYFIKNIDFLSILAFIGVVAVIISSFLLLGLLVSTVGAVLVPVLIATFLICISLMKIARTLRKIEKIKIDKDKVKENIRGMLEALIEPLAILDGKAWTTLIKALFKLRTIKKLSRQMWIIAKNVSKIAKLTFDDGTGKSVNLTQGDLIQATVTGQQLISSLLGIFFDESGNETSVMKQIDNVKQKLVRKMRKLKRITRIIGRIATLVSRIAALKMPDPTAGFDKDGLPNKWVSMTTNDFIKTTETGQQLISSLLGIFFDESGNETSVMKLLGNMNRKTVRQVRALKDITRIIGRTANIVSRLASMQVADQWDNKGNPIHYTKLTDGMLLDATNSAIKITTCLITAITGDELGNAIDSLNKQKQKQAQMLKDCVQPILDMTNTVMTLAGGEVTEFDANGRPTGKTISLIKALESKDKIISSVKSIYSIFAEALSCIVGKSESTEGKSFFGKVGTKIANGAKSVVNSISASFDADLVQKRVGAVIEPLKGMIECVQKISEISKNADQYAADNFKLLLTSAVAAVTNITAQDFGTLTARQSILREYAETIRKFMDANSNNAAPDNAAKTFDAAGKFVVKLNSVSDSKLDKMASIAKNMAAFAQKINGNFDKLADAMNDKLVKALEKVDETLKDVNKTFTEVPDKLPKPTGNAGVHVIQEQKPSTVKVTPKQEEKKKEIATAASKSLNNCIVQTEDGTFALAVVQKSE